MRSLDEIRAQFPALGSPTVYLDNAGGSQVPRVVADRIHDYMLSTYAQLGADYDVSRQSTATVERARELLGVLVNSSGLGKVAMGPSTSMLCAVLADCYRRAPDPDRDEIIVCEAGHEANIGPWLRLADSGYRLHTWRLDPDTFECPLDQLRGLLGPRTRIVAVPHVSNILGEIMDVATIAAMCHEVGARVVIDGVAFAPHRAVDVAALGADWYMYSAYKVFGPHMAVLYGRDEAFAEITGPNHFFVDRADVTYSFELGGVLHEGCAGLCGLWDYLCFLSQEQQPNFARSTVEKAFAEMADLEATLTEKLCDYVNSKPELRMIGPSRAGPTRVSTVSFVHADKTSREPALAANARGFGIRYGHFYAYRLFQALGMVPEDGVVRVSALHYNTHEELDRLTTFFDQIL